MKKENPMLKRSQKVTQKEHSANHLSFPPIQVFIWVNRCENLLTRYVRPLRCPRENWGISLSLPAWGEFKATLSVLRLYGHYLVIMDGQVVGRRLRILLRYSLIAPIFLYVLLTTLFRLGFLSTSDQFRHRRDWQTAQLWSWLAYNINLLCNYWQQQG